jgi:hypothetical protein
MEWRDGGMEGWRVGGLEGWRDGGMEGWRDGGMEGWRDGGMEGWRVGGLEGWRVGGLEEVHDIGNLLLATSSKIPEGIGKFVCESQPEIKDGSDAVERTDTRSESRSEAGD